jgi:uncharacterized protein YbcV (DUF1398 family)
MASGTQELGESKAKCCCLAGRVKLAWGIHKNQRGSMNRELLRETLHGSETGKLTFPDVVRVLVGEGVESYRVDLIRGEDIFFMPDGETHREKMTLPSRKISEQFSQPGIMAAIRAAQADQIRYPEFLNQAMAAGVIGYWVFLTGKRVIYFGRNGEFHVEEFPPAKS